MKQMGRRSGKRWLRYGDFILLDMLCLQLCFIAAFWLIRGPGDPYALGPIRYLAVVLQLSQLAVLVFTDSYRGILRRGAFDELLAVGRLALETLVTALVYLFAAHRSAVVSRLQMGVTLVIFLAADTLVRVLNRRRRLRGGKDRNRRALVLITSADLAGEALRLLSDTEDEPDYFLSEILLTDGDPETLGGCGVPAAVLDRAALDRISHDWVDEVLVLQPDGRELPAQLMEQFIEMGITVSFSAAALNDDRWPFLEVERLGRCRTLTSSMHYIPAGQLFLKRCMDILGGAAGCVLTGVIFLFAAPLIRLKSPGPVFFRQERVGRNGRVFTMYKFRTMVPDAEDRKDALREQNRFADGMMFKMEDDPRIIGSGKKDRNGRPRGIGHFLRDTMLDEFPQFFNVLKGDMSLVGWRPCTLDEWEKYGRGHRIRASMKPGLTGLWQISDRKRTSDFAEVMRLDREYMENWSLWLDLRILLRTCALLLRSLFVRE